VDRADRPAFVAVRNPRPAGGYGSQSGSASRRAAQDYADGLESDRRREVGEFCLYWGANLSGSVSDFNSSVPDYNQPICLDFKGPGQGQGQCVKDNAQSAWNRTTGTVIVYYHPNYGNSSDVFASGQAGDLTATYLHNESHRFVQS